MKNYLRLIENNISIKSHQKIDFLIYESKVRFEKN